MTSCYHGHEIPGSQRSFLTETAFALSSNERKVWATIAAAGYLDCFELLLQKLKMNHHTEHNLTLVLEIIHCTVNEKKR